MIGELGLWDHDIEYEIDDETGLEVCVHGDRKKAKSIEK